MYLTDLEVSFLIRVESVEKQFLVKDVLNKFFIIEHGFDSDDVKNYFETTLLRRQEEVEIWKINFLKLFISSANFSDIFEDKDTFFQQIKEYLNKQENFKLTGFYKVFDCEDFERNDYYYNKISEIELELREILTYIFWSTYPSTNEYKLTYEYDTKIRKNDNKDEIGKYFQNEFSFLDFGEYNQILVTKSVFKDINDLGRYLEENSDFDSFKENILNRGVKKESFTLFMEEIASDLKTIQNFRNRIMHNRNFSIDEERNVEIVIDDLNKKFDNFWSSLEVNSDH